jgi:hypothetical protein
VSEAGALERLVRRDRWPRVVRIVGAITLMEAWTSDNPDKIFARQAFKIREETKSARLGRDGRLLVVHQPMNVVWYGGRSEDLINAARVRIVTGRCVLVDAALDMQRGPLRRVRGGISFDVISAP